MKKLASFLLTLTTGIAAWFLCACLVLITGLYAYSVGSVFTPALPTPILSTEASVPVTNTELHVSFKQPQGWTLIESGTLSNQPWPVPYATYGLKGQPDALTFTISKHDFGALVGQDLLVHTLTESNQRRGAEIIEELRVTIAGLPAGGVRYIRERELGFELMVDERGQTHTFRWTSDVEYINELRQIYKAMLPTIRIEPPPP